jgi:type IV pilus assembly protein PilC
MLAAGLPLVQAARITADVADNLLIGEDIGVAVEGVIEGNRLGDGLKKSRWMPSLLLEMTAVGEETGKLEETLDVVSEYYTKEVDTSVKAALGLLEPVIVIVMAVLVVFILLSVYLPLFSMYGSV